MSGFFENLHHEATETVKYNCESFITKPPTKDQTPYQISCSAPSNTT